MKLATLALLTALGLGGLAGTASADPAPRGQLRQLLLERFDANHDGRLERRERRRAVRALRRIARHLAIQDRRAGRAHHRGERDGADAFGPADGPPGMTRQAPPERDDDQ